MARDVETIQPVNHSFGSAVATEAATTLSTAARGARKTGKVTGILTGLATGASGFFGPGAVLGILGALCAAPFAFIALSGGAALAAIAVVGLGIAGATGVVTGVTGYLAGAGAGGIVGGVVGAIVGLFKGPSRIQAEKRAYDGQQLEIQRAEAEGRAQARQYQAEAIAQMQEEEGRRSAMLQRIIDQGPKGNAVEQVKASREAAANQQGIA